MLLVGVGYSRVGALQITGSTMTLEKELQAMKTTMKLLNGKAECHSSINKSSLK